MAVLKMI